MPFHSESEESTEGMSILRVIDLLHAIACQKTLFRLEHIAVSFVDLTPNVVSRHLHVFHLKGLVERVYAEGEGERHKWFRTIHDQRLLPTPDTVESAGKRIARVLDILQCIRDTNGEPFRNKEVCDAVGIAPNVATRYLQILTGAGVIRPYGKYQYCIAWEKQGSS